MPPASSSGEEIVVFSVRRREGQCDRCAKEVWKGEWIRLVDDEKGGRRALCMACAGLDYLVRLPTGDAALTRRAKKHSGTVGVVVRWATARKRYERTGWLLEEDAIERAMDELRAEGKEPKWRLEGDYWVRTDEVPRRAR